MIIEYIGDILMKVTLSYFLNGMVFRQGSEHWNIDYLCRQHLVYDLAQVQQYVAEEVDGPGCIIVGGYRSMWQLHFDLKEFKFLKKWQCLQQLWRNLSLSCEIRTGKWLKRKKFHAPGPNHCWHIDGYNKLKPFGFPIHGCVDSWSRKIMCCK